MNDELLSGRLLAATERLTGLVRALRERGPWPLAARFDHVPEAAWGPPEILAHLGEMLPYWLGEAERVIDADSQPAPFGRLASDDVRLAIIGRDRTLPLRELSARVQAGIERWNVRWAELDSPSRSRLGLHPKLGQMTIEELATRFVVIHLEEHLDQLDRALRGEPPG